MGLFRFLSPRTGEHELQALVDGIAARCRDAVARVAIEHTLEMTVAEAKGYVRARTRGLIRHAVDAALREHRHIAARRHAQVHALALNTVVAQALDRRDVRQLVVQPYRRAA